MPLICLAADKGSPGVTTTSVALAAVWPRPVLLAETDPAGSDLVYTLTGDGRQPLDPDRGLLSLGTATGNPGPADVSEHIQTAYGGLSVLLGVPGPAQSRALAQLWAPLGRALAAMPDADVLADCGRLATAEDPPTVALLSHADLILLLARDHIASIAHLRDRIAALQASWAPGDAPLLATAIVCDQQRRDYVVGEARKLFRRWHLPAALVTTIAHDPEGAAALLPAEPRRRLAEPLLVRSARRLADELLDQLARTVEAPR